MTIEATLQKLGLSKNEAQVYLCLLELGQGTGYEISTKLDIKRPTAYFFLEELRKKGMVTRLPQGRKHVFVPKDPRDLVVQTQQLVSDVELMLPKLLAKASNNRKANITYFENWEGFLEAEKAIVQHAKDKEMVAFFYFEDKPYADFVENLDDFYDQLARLGASIRAITPDHPSTRSLGVPQMEKHGWEIRLLPLEAFPSRSSIEVVGDLTRICSKRLGQNILIENKDIATTMRAIFEIAFATAKKV